MVPVEGGDSAARVEDVVEEESRKMSVEEEGGKLQAEDVPFEYTLITSIVTLMDMTSTQITQVKHTTHRRWDIITTQWLLITKVSCRSTMTSLPDMNHKLMWILIQY